MVPVAGRATINTPLAHLLEIGDRMSPFERRKP